MRRSDSANFASGLLMLPLPLNEDFLCIPVSILIAWWDVRHFLGLPALNFFRSQVHEESIFWILVWISSLFSYLHPFCRCLLRMFLYYLSTFWGAVHSFSYFQKYRIRLNQFESRFAISEWLFNQIIFLFEVFLSIGH